MTGMYIDYQRIKTEFENINLVSDTIKMARRDFRGRFPVLPLLSKSRETQWNVNAYVGAMYITTGKYINFKTFFNIGYNRLSYSLVSSVREVAVSGGHSNLFIRFHTDATLLASPGVSIGLESYMRAGQPPLFNFTFTKVIDIRQIGGLFSKVPSL
jgi:hypothetical protein